MNGRPMLGAHVAGLSAKVIAGLLDDRMPGRLVALQRLAAQGLIPAQRVAEVADTWAAIREAARHWASANGSTEEAVTEIPPSSSEIDSTRAAQLLAVSPSRVRQLVRGGQLNGRKAAGVWLLDRGEVELRREVTNGLLRRNAGCFPQDRA